MQVHVGGMRLEVEDESNDVLEWVELRHDQLGACNSEEEPDKVKPTARSTAGVVDPLLDTVSAQLAPASWNMIRVRVERVTEELT